MTFNDSIHKTLIFLKRHWRKILVSVVFGIPLFFIGSLFLAVVFFTVRDSIYDKITNRQSPYLGKEVRVAPFATFTKMKTYGGKRDDFFYIYVGRAKIILFSNTVPTVFKELDDYVTLKVVEVKDRVTHGFGTLDVICIMENIKDPKEKVSEICENITAINEVTDVFQAAELDIKKFGSAYLSFDKKASSQSMMAIRDEGTVLTYKVSSRTELVELFTGLGLVHYFGIMEDAHPVLVKNRAKFD